MKETALKTIQHFGVEHQQRKLQEEVFELQEAITCYELNNSVSYEIPLCELAYGYEHIVEELADCYNLLMQFRENYMISDEEINKVIKKKQERTNKIIEAETKASTIEINIVKK